MENRIKIFDTTLRDGEQSPGFSMNLKEKVEIAKQLEKLGVDVIEAGFAIASPEDFESVRTIAQTVKNCTVASLSRCVKGDIDRAYEAVKVAAHPRIHIFLATSNIHMKYKLKMTKEQVLAKTKESVAYAKSLTDDIEFSAEDASRSDRDFLAEVVRTAIAAGATTINIPDTVGYVNPVEMAGLIAYLREQVPEFTTQNVDLSVHCHDDLGMATACTMASIKAGATQVEVTLNGIGERAGNTALEEVVMGLHTRKDYYNAYCNIDAKQIYRSSKLLSSITGVSVAPNKSVVGANAFAHESGIHQHGVLNEPTTYEIFTPESIGVPQNKMVLGKHSGKHAFADRLKTLGYNLSDDEITEAFVEFKKLADRKKSVNDRDIEALVTSSGIEVEQKFELVNYVINSGSTITSTATVALNVNGKKKEKVAIGSGPVDACFTAIEKIIRSACSLENYSIQAVTEGEDALGEAIVKLKSGEDIITGRGLSTDIIESSIKAYLSALGKVSVREA